MGRYYNKRSEKRRDRQEEEDYDYDNIELMELYDVQKQIENDIRLLWDNVLVRYIEYCNESQILNELSSSDYTNFFEYMIKNNTKYKYVLNRINELENLK